jgi:hypothetical protein
MQGRLASVALLETSYGGLDEGGGGPGLAGYCMTA